VGVDRFEFKSCDGKVCLSYDIVAICEEQMYNSYAQSRNMAKDDIVSINQSINEFIQRSSTMFLMRSWLVLHGCGSPGVTGRR